MCWKNEITASADGCQLKARISGLVDHINASLTVPVDMGNANKQKEAKKFESTC